MRGVALYISAGVKFEFLQNSILTSVGELKQLLYNTFFQ